MVKNTLFLSVLLLVIFFMTRFLLRISMGEGMDSLLIRYTDYDNISREIIENGISLSVSFVTMGLMHKHVFRNFKIIHGPFIEVGSIILGTIITLLLYDIYKIDQ